MKLTRTFNVGSLTEANKGIIQFELSVLEGPVPAVQSKKCLGRPQHLKPTRDEMVHIHPPDGSTHLVLSLADSRQSQRKVTARGIDWAAGFSAGTIL
jgi:hypothetical protein